MTKILLPKLLEKKGGVIVNLSLSVAELDSPMFSVYNATKVIISVSYHTCISGMYYSLMKCPPLLIFLFSHDVYVRV
jgi:NADP-dependent 3-hydroxy acid dehydrogenase YdfG